MGGVDVEWQDISTDQRSGLRSIVSKPFESYPAQFSMISTKLSVHPCKATGGDMARVFRELAVFMEDNPSTVLLGLWTNCSAEDDLEVQAIWEET